MAEQRATTVDQVGERRWCGPISDELLAQIETAGLVVNDNDHTVIAYYGGRKVGAVWGPAVEGHWFAYRGPETEAIRVPTRDDGLRHLLGHAIEAVPS